eukprot:410140-Heterocapsa_arctica.AAC.1
MGRTPPDWTSPTRRTGALVAPTVSVTRSSVNGPRAWPTLTLAVGRSHTSRSASGCRLTPPP